jgi:hypothetical protein
MFSIKQSAEIVGIGEGQLILWVSIKKFVPSGVASLKSTDFATGSLAARALESYTGKGEEALGWNRFWFTDADIIRLRALVAKTATAKAEVLASHVDGTHYTAREVAALWGCGVDKIRELFGKEPDVIKMKNPAKRNKQAYTSLRIPQSVVERVSRRMSS